MVHDNNYSADKMAQVFGITVANQMANVQARVLPAPMVCSILNLMICILFFY